MAMASDKWVMFRNFMYNELGITKEEVREWINDAIEEQVKLVVDNTFSKVDVERICEKTIVNELRDSYKIKEALLNKIVESLCFK